MTLSMTSFLAIRKYRQNMLACITHRALQRGSAVVRSYQGGSEQVDE